MLGHTAPSEISDSHHQRQSAYGGAKSKGNVDITQTQCPSRKRNPSMQVSSSGYAIVLIASLGAQSASLSWDLSAASNRIGASIACLETYDTVDAVQEVRHLVERKTQVFSTNPGDNDLHPVLFVKPLEALRSPVQVQHSPEIWVVVPFDSPGIHRWFFEVWSHILVEICALVGTLEVTLAVVDNDENPWSLDKTTNTFSCLAS